MSDFDLFDDIKEKGTEEWVGMPVFNANPKALKGMSKEIADTLSRRMAPYQSVTVNFRTKEDREDFERLLNQRVMGKGMIPSIWYPEQKKSKTVHLRYVSKTHPLPIYPIYVISKGRWENRLTSKILEANGVPYRIVVEPQEYSNYAEVIDPDKILVLPFSNLGQGSIPARNWVWEHAISIGAERHWILDDNISDFYRLNNNVRIRVGDGVCFRIVEDFVNRYENVPMAGMNYTMFTPETETRPYYLNTRVYSCILLYNNLTIDGEPVRWRGRYNEDTDLSLRILKAGYCTFLSNAFSAQKARTMTMKGGNTEDLYKIKDGRLKMAQSLVEQHPDVTTITEKWGRFQHQVNYEPFKRNKLILKPDAIIPEGDPYGIELVDITETMENPDIPDEEFDNPEGYTIDPEGYTIDPDQED